MSPDEFCAARDVVGWSTAKLADEINVDLRTVRRWISGEMPIPPRIAEWLTELAAEHVARPVPGA